MKNKRRLPAKMKFGFLIAAIGVTASCGGAAVTNSVVPKNAAVSPAQTVSPKSEATTVPEPTPKAGIVEILKKSKGKYPYELKLLENEEMKSRLQKLLGVD